MPTIEIQENATGNSVVVNGSQRLAVSNSGVEIGAATTGVVVACRFGSGGMLFTNAAETSSTPVGVRFTAASHTGLANAELVEVDFNLNRSVAFAGGGAAIANQRAVRMQAPTYTAASAQTITTAATLDVSGPPVAGANVTISSFGVNAGAFAARFGGKVRLDNALVIRSSTNDGLFITDASGNGMSLQKQSNTRWYWFPQGLATTWQQFFIQEMFANITAGVDTQYTIGTETARFSTISVTQTAVKSHNSFSGSRTFEATGAVTTATNATTTVFASPALIDNSGTWVEVHVVGRATGTADRAMAVRRALITRQAGGGAALVGTFEAPYTNNAPGWGVTNLCSIDVSGNTFVVRVEGAATTINWTCTVRYQSVSGAV